MAQGVRLENVTIVLNRPRYPENIGAAARALCNMGIRRLAVVSPERCDLTRVLRLATHAAIDVVEEMGYFDDLREALAPFHYVVGTTARQGRERQFIMNPEQCAEELISISQNNEVALLFGPEDRGLTNEELRLCHYLVTIPTDQFSSLNLAQAVMVLCYEIFKTGRPVPRQAAPRLASRIELDGMYDHVKDLLVRIDYILPDNPDYWMNKLRRFFTRLQLRAGEVGMIRGICRQIDWYAGKCYRDGVTGAAPPKAFSATRSIQEQLDS